jgi:SAM-dependent methyltransferase
MPPSDNHPIVEFYERNVDQYGDSFGAVGWGSRESQRRRFHVLAEIANLRGAAILDIGCGLGDFYGYLREHGIDMQYAGYDLSPKMIGAARAKFPGVPFETKDILAEKVEVAFDYVFASGTFNLRVKDSDRGLKAMISRMYEIARRGVGFNVMSTYADYFNEAEYYARPEALFTFCMSLTHRVVLRHDYMPHDFTIWMYRETSDQVRML